MSPFLQNKNVIPLLVKLLFEKSSFKGIIDFGEAKMLSSEEIAGAPGGTIQC